MSDPWCETNYCDRQDLLAEVKAKDAEIAKLREALETIALTQNGVKHMRRVAREALAQQGESDE